MNEQGIKDLRQRAVKLLARREHTREELLRKLATHGSQEEIEIVLNELTHSGLQSDARFAESYLRTQAARFGMSRLRQTLRKKGVAPETIAGQIEDLPDELERALRVWAKKFAAVPADASEWARQARFLQGRGFSAEIIYKLLKEREE